MLNQQLSTPMEAITLLHARQAAERIGRSLSTLHYYVDVGRLPVAMQAPGAKGAMFFHPDDVDALAAELAGS